MPFNVFQRTLRVVCLESPATKVLVQSCLFRRNPLTEGLASNKHSVHTSACLAGRYSGRRLAERPEEYTTKPLRLVSTGGWDEEGNHYSRRLGGGNRRKYRMIDWNRARLVQGKTPYKEVVVSLDRDCNRSATIALVAAGEVKRYILATVNMKPGDIITTFPACHEMKTYTVAGKEGDCHSVGSLPLGTLVNSVEVYPGTGARLAKSAGCQAKVARRVPGAVLVAMPSGKEAMLHPGCMATVGQIANPDHSKLKLTKAGVNRWFGIRPKSGLKKKKTGFDGKAVRKKKIQQKMAGNPLLRNQMNPNLKVLTWNEGTRLWRDDSHV
ncbi:39S ribosomal protein L2, mitochondrial [Lingula anatina]|uniref:39S ribosomal protein L2, mitochondrial n=1 Tax=Lingula anatina TaxID=7574 RepID=A0A1S3K2Q0_LINAN|nr:39S ribosomal protein L2, mitochondrial [Lingula anatina]|eukprot:XP_013416913.1 39S ribosomal protein L2, mitochondrial [Lingula anatina]